MNTRRGPYDRIVRNVNEYADPSISRLSGSVYSTYFTWPMRGLRDTPGVTLYGRNGQQTVKVQLWDDPATGETQVRVVLIVNQQQELLVYDGPLAGTPELHAVEALRGG